MEHSLTNWHVDRDRAADWEALWDAMQAVARQARGFRYARLLRSVEHAGKYVVYAEWDARSDWDAFYGDPRVQELTSAAFKLLKGPPVQEWYAVERDETVNVATTSVVPPTG